VYQGSGNGRVTARVVKGIWVVRQAGGQRWRLVVGQGGVVVVQVWRWRKQPSVHGVVGGESRRRTAMVAGVPYCVPVLSTEWWVGGDM